jgi:hypothetical protein
VLCVCEREVGACEEPGGEGGGRVGRAAIARHQVPAGARHAVTRLPPDTGHCGRLRTKGGGCAVCRHLRLHQAITTRRAVEGSL